MEHATIKKIIKCINQSEHNCICKNST